MDEVRNLDEYRIAAAHERRRAARPTFYFDIASPYTYLAAERVERMFGTLDWQPAHAAGLHSGTPIDDRERCLIAQRAARLGLPIVWPMGPAVRVVGAMRVASLAIERGTGAQFVLAACRLVYCGGFDVEDPTILAEAAAVAGISLGDMLGAVGERERDVTIADAGRSLVAEGADCLPAMRVRGLLFCGEDRLPEAAAAARATA